MEQDNHVKIKLGSLVLMIFSSIFGFSNSLTAFYQMGYASIIWYIVTAILFFLPSALIFAEYGAAFKGIKGGIFSWLEGSTNEKIAFIGTFIWLSAWVVWLVSSTQFFLVSVSTAVFGKVKMQGWFAWVMWLVVHLRSILGVRNKVVVLLNWVWNYFTYDQSMRMIVYARKAKEIRDREAIEATTHWGKDLMQEPQPAKQEPQPNSKEIV